MARFSQFVSVWSWPFGLEYYSWGTAALLWLALSAPILYLGIKSLGGMSAIRRWTIIGIRLAVLTVLIAVLCGFRWERKATNVEVYCLRDASDSTSMVQNFPGRSLQRSIDDFFVSMSKDPRKQTDDTIGVIGFRGIPTFEAIAARTLSLDGRATPLLSTGTDVAAALQMAMASMSSDKMHRIVLLWDGNQTMGNLDGAVATAAAMHVPIDIFPLDYNLQNEIMLERVVAPSWRRENEPFSLEVFLRSTNAVPVTGKLIVSHGTRDGAERLTDKPIPVKLQPGLNHVSVQAPALKNGGVHRFLAEFVADPDQGKVDTLSQNNSAEAFTVVRGKGTILYVNNSFDSSGMPNSTLRKALADEKINLREISVSQLPDNLIYLQDYDAVVLDNVPRGAGGISSDQDAMLRHYVHDLGGGLVMIGGENGFGAGGWAGSEVEKILPVDMDIPAQRQVGKGALVLIMDPGEIPEGTYWGEQCAIKAVEALSSLDEVGIVDYNPMTGQCEWVLPIQEKGDGSAVLHAIKKMQDGDLPNFDDAVRLVLNGGTGARGLIQSNARHKHVIIISDGDSMGCSAQTIQTCLNNKISISTVTAFAEDPSDPNVPIVMHDIAKATHGKAYGPINRAPNQLPQIFIKEAQIVRRTLIQENEHGIPVKLIDAADDVIRGMSHFDPLFGQVLVSRKGDPRVAVPLVSGKMNDPILAHWMAGLGKSVAFTSDAHHKWGALWADSASYSRFWAQVVRSVARAPMSSDFEVDTKIDGSHGHVRVTASDVDGEGRNFLNVSGTIIGPDMKDIPVRLNQTAPGTYEGDFAAPQTGTYVAGLQYVDRHGKGGMLMSGVSMDSSPEMRDLQSNDAKLEEVRVRTGGRRINSWDAVEANVFTREGLFPATQLTPVWDVLLIVLLGLILLDVTARRIAWDWDSTRRLAIAIAKRVEAFTTLRRADASVTLAALKGVRQEVQNRQSEMIQRTTLAAPPAMPRPNPKSRFEAPKGVEGNITDVVSGATATPTQPAKPAPTNKTPATQAPSYTASLLDAKRRARERMRSAEGEPPAEE